MQKNIDINKIKEEIRDMLLRKLELHEYGQLRLIALLSPQVNIDYQYFLLEALEDIFGNPPTTGQGINSMMEQLINLRSILYAFQSLHKHEFLSTDFFKIFHQTMTYAIISLFGKLFDKRKDVVSLKKAWIKIYEFLEKSDEVKDINNFINTNTNPLSLHYRHEVISHAASNTNLNVTYDWESFDDDLNKLVIAWRILHEFLEIPLLHPRLLDKPDIGKEIFKSIKNFNTEEVNLLFEQYCAYIDKHIS